MNVVVRSLQPAVITIDGPAGSGKSTVGNLLTQKINYLFFDTGILYRAVTLAAIEHSVDLGDEVALSRLAESVKIDLYPPAANESDGRLLTVMLEGVDVTWQIRTPEVERNVSPVSAVVGVRQALTEQQRRIGHYYGTGQAEKPGIVMVGRDIGTIVMPEAPVKIYLEALPAERARRRCEELRARGKATDYALVLADIQRRDQIDSSRAIAPLRPAADAFIIDTTNLAPDEVVDMILQAIVA